MQFVDWQWPLTSLSSAGAAALCCNLAGTSRLHLVLSLGAASAAAAMSVLETLRHLLAPGQETELASALCGLSASLPPELWDCLYGSGSESSSLATTMCKGQERAWEASGFENPLLSPLRPS